MVIGAAGGARVVQHVRGVEAGQRAQGALDLGFRLDLFGHPPTRPVSWPWRDGILDHRSWHGNSVASRRAGRESPYDGPP